MLEKISVYDLVTLVISNNFAQKVLGEIISLCIYF